MKRPGAPSLSRTPLLCCGLVLWCALATLGHAAQQPLPVGDQFQVNTYTTRWQTIPSVAMSPEGDFVVVWYSYDSSATIKGQRFASSGVATGPEFPVNTYYPDGIWPTAALEAAGNFVVVWTSNSSPGTDFLGYSIQAQRYGSDGNAVGSQFQVNSYITAQQQDSSVAASPGGGFVVVWQSQGSSGTDTSLDSIQAQRFASDGSPSGSEFQVNTLTTERQWDPSVAVDPDGDFVVVWTSQFSSGVAHTVQAQRFSSDGSALGSEFQVNGLADGHHQYNSTVAVDPDGDFVVAWQWEGGNPPGGTDTDGDSILARRFASDGSPAGSAFQVNTYTTSSQTYPLVAMDGAGSFVVAWRSYGSSGTDGDTILAQAYASDGSPLGGEFQVNTYTPFMLFAPSLAMASGGDFVVVWSSIESTGTDTSDESVQAQRLVLPIFADGFESGDTTAWSSSVP